MFVSWRSIVHFVNTRQYLGGLTSGLLVALLCVQYGLFVCPGEDCSFVGDLNPIRLKRQPIMETDVMDKALLAPSDNNAAPTTQDRILCWVVTTPANKFKAKVVKNTWGRRCDKLLFMSSKSDPSLPAIGLHLPGPDSRQQLWNKAKLTFRYIYKNHLNDYDWFFKADDDTYAIMENMRQYLSTLNRSETHFLGRRFHQFLSGGSGYVLSRETLRMLVEKGLDQKMCHTFQPGDYDDVSIAECMQTLNITFGDTRDTFGHQRFIPYNVEEFYNDTGANMDFIHGADYYPILKGYNCCSNHPITFHYVSGYKMHLYEYLLYKLKIYNETLRAFI